MRSNLIIKILRNILQSMLNRSMPGVTGAVDSFVVVRIGLARRLFYDAQMKMEKNRIEPFDEKVFFVFDRQFSTMD
ncbi:hypothetical protein [Brevibacillus gelatini]|uniref:Uncharacterized protein n=1 Tax=Brevibacillus gelatini TaxID=1655277 RepID=A0A3M8AKG5_9BACL|nr:hypothetical protein [Brevibacillus gelatini]RNB51716.1 hypothetical protein EDM57_22105 [Brevibacillus gelatini]